MRRVSRGAWVVVVLLAAGGLALAQPPEDTAVATVGDARITVADVQLRVRKTPLFQLRALGSDFDAARRRVLDQLVSEALLVKGAEEAKLPERPDVNERMRSVLVSALLGDIRREAEAPGAVSEEAIRAYYEAHKDRYEAQQRVKIWQIVLDKKEDADAMLEYIRTNPEYRTDPVAGWDKLARERSLDKASAMRKGNLGFVQPDGSTAHKSVKVPPEMYQVAAKLNDGQVSPEPLQVGEYWVIVQRRGAHQTPSRTIEDEAATIRGILAKQQVTDRVKDLLKKLRAQHVRDENGAAVDRIDITPQGNVTPLARPGTLPRAFHPPAGSPRPEGEPGNLR